MGTDRQPVERLSLRRDSIALLERPDAQAERLRRIREVAYLKAERRGFAPGFECQDWLDAEREVDGAAHPSVLPLPSNDCLRPRNRRGSSVEHRQGRRVPIRVPVRLNLCDGQMYRGYICDVCRDGMFVRTQTRLNKSGCLEVRIDSFNVIDKLYVDIPVFVVHRDKGGYGLMFRALDEDAAAVVQHLRAPRPTVVLGSAARIGRYGNSG